MSSATRITHLHRRPALGRAPPSAPSDVLQPGDRRAHRPRRPRLRRPGRPGRRHGQAGLAPSWGSTSLAKRAQVLFAFRELLNARKERIAALITAEHGKVLSRRARRGDAGPRGRRVRVRHPAPAQGRVQRERLDRASTSTRSGSRSAWWRDLPVQLPGDGAAVVRPDRDRVRQRGGAQAEREGPVGGARHRRRCGRGRACRTGS